jgi:hypothetical protein
MSRLELDFLRQIHKRTLDSQGQQKAHSQGEDQRLEIHEHVFDLCALPDKGAFIGAVELLEPFRIHEAEYNVEQAARVSERRDGVEKVPIQYPERGPEATINRQILSNRRNKNSNDNMKLSVDGRNGGVSNNIILSIGLRREYLR